MRLTVTSILFFLLFKSIAAQKIVSEYYDTNIFSGFKEPIGLAILKFDGSEDFDIKLFDEFKLNQNFFNKFTPFTYDVLDKQKKILRIPSLDPNNPNVLRALKELDIYIILTGKTYGLDSVQLELLRTDGQKIFSAIYKNSSNSTIINDITKLFYENKTTEYKKLAPPGMILIQGGEFLMGNENGNKDEKPAHKVKVKSFYLDIYEVSQKEFEAVMGYNPSTYKNPDAPVENVTWFEANEYAKKVGKRLPTEAEWEYAARGGIKSSDNVINDMNNIQNVIYNSSNSLRKIHTNKDTKAYNSLGLFNMLGNVWEWCNDWYENDYYAKSEYDNPQGPLQGKYKVLRGGAWTTSSEKCNPFYRYSLLPNHHGSSIGFRCAKDY